MTTTHWLLIAIMIDIPLIFLVVNTERIAKALEERNKQTFKDQ